MYGRAIPQVDADGRGIHVLWFGPVRWGYAPGGWVIERRLYPGPTVEPVCNFLSDKEIILLDGPRERRLDFGVLTLEDGLWPEHLTSTEQNPKAAQVFRVRLDRPREGVDVTVQGPASFGYALRGGKVVATSGPFFGELAHHRFREIGIDVVVIHALESRGLTVCVLPDERESGGWSFVGQRQLPLKELDPALADVNDEVHEALSRLLPAETLNPDEVLDVLERLRPVAARSGPPPASFWTLLLREPDEEDVMEVGGIDPLRALVSHPSWRRALGFGLFDEDPALEPGKVYQYRITGELPRADLIDAVYGFHTVPTGTALPAVFQLGELGVRLNRPASIELAWDKNQEMPAVGRRGLRLRPLDGSPWLLPNFGKTRLVLDFPEPVRVVELELDEGHELEWRAGSMGIGPAEDGQVPPGPRPRLVFSAPREQVRLEGEGLLFSVRVPADPGVPPDKLFPVSIVLPPVVFDDTKRPAPPVFVAAHSLQASPPALPPGGGPPKREALGLEVLWTPALLGGLEVFPPGAGVAPPTEATLFEIEHREEKASGDPLSDWTPILPPPEENWVTGDRDAAVHENKPFPGADLLELFPEEGRETPGNKLGLRWRDVFDFPEGLPENTDLHRKPPEPGGFHRYRIRSVDSVGRPSEDWTESNPVLLEKRVPPPEPVGPDPDPDADPLPTARGVQVRVLVPGAPDLTAEETALLGSSQNAIVLRWGWHAEQREMDPLAAEFRVYGRRGDPDAVTGRITQVTNLGQGRYDVTLQMDRPVPAGEAVGVYVSAPKAFRVDSHGTGTVITARLSTRVTGPGGTFPAPVTGPVRLPVRVSADFRKPAAWDQRLQVVPLTTASTYQVVLRDRLTLSESQPRDTVWVGVSTADAQDYVPDALPGGGRPGNESSIVPVRCDGRYYGRPGLVETLPPLGPVPRVRTPEPKGRSVSFDLDLTGFVPSNPFAAGSAVRPERVSAGAVVRACRIDGTGRILARAPEPLRPGDVEIEMGQNLAPEDRAAIQVALASFELGRLADRHLVWLASRHPYRDRLFEIATPDTVPFKAFPQELPGAGERWLYRLRRGNAAGRLSPETQMAAVVVRVPSPAPGAPPERLPVRDIDPPGVMRLRVPGDAVLTQMVLFLTPPPSEGGLLREAELLRAPDTAEPEKLRLRTADGTLQEPIVVDLNGPDLMVDTDGSRILVLQAREEPWVVQAATVTEDGVPSLLAGPWTLSRPATVPAGDERKEQ
jgi:hypothetical protein